MCKCGAVDFQTIADEQMCSGSPVRPELIRARATAMLLPGVQDILGPVWRPHISSDTCEARLNKTYSAMGWFCTKATSKRCARLYLMSAPACQLSRHTGQLRRRLFRTSLLSS